MKIKKEDIFVGQIEFLTNGHASINLGEKQIYINKKNTGKSLHLDTVKVEIFKGQKKLEAKVIEVISRFRTEFVGKAQVTEKNTFVIPDSNKISVDFYAKGGLVPKNNQKVLVELTKWEDTKSPQVKIIKILGNSGDNETEMNSIMYEYNLPVEFSEEVIRESEDISEKISDDDVLNRRDLRDVVTFTIDPVDAKDFDDALSIQKNDDDTFNVGVHIADVSHYIKPETKLDQEAYSRSTSVYLVDRCVPMLPERLSNGICSLKPNEDRLAFSVVFKLDSKCSILDTWFGKTVINSKRRFTYEEAQKVIESGEGEYNQEISILNLLAIRLRNSRIKEGSIEMGRVEVKFKLADDNKKPIGVYLKEQKESNKLIEEFMLLANKAVAAKLSEANWQNVYRVHDRPNAEKLNQLVNVCQTFGYGLEIETDDRNLKNSINQLTSEIKGKPEENMISTLITRSMSKAYYSTKNIGHYGLGFTHYSHFTSPIRRYPDLIVHRILFDFLSNKFQKNTSEIEDQCKWTSQRELISSKAQRDSIKYKQAEYLLDKIGKVFDGIVSGITEWGLYVEIIENKCEGMISYKSINGKWSIDLDSFFIKNQDNEKITLGDQVKVVVNSVDLEKKQINFRFF